MSGVGGGKSWCFYRKYKAELLQLLLERESRQTQSIGPYPRGDSARSTGLPTSWAQQRLWFIDQLEERAVGYFCEASFTLRGLLDEVALQKALDTLVERHEAPTSPRLQ